MLQEPHQLSRNTGLSNLLELCDVILPHDLIVYMSVSLCFMCMAKGRLGVVWLL
jgi:hypothetical protein